MTQTITPTPDLDQAATDGRRTLDIAFFGSSLVSAYWNGAATYYRGMIRALHGLGHRVTFHEPDAFDRQAHRDLAEDPDYATVNIYGGEGDAWREPFRQAAASADVVIKASGVGVFDEQLERALADLARGRAADAPGPLCIFWDVDAPATLDRMSDDPADRGNHCVGAYDAVFTYGGGQPVIDAYTAAGARGCVPLYNAHDPDTHHPVTPRDDLACDLAFLGNRLPDREARVDDFFFDAARRCPDQRFLLGGSGWDDKPMPDNVRYLGHVGTADHNALNSSARCVLNISRDSMAAFGFSPATRVFEACAAGACMITDHWIGLDHFYAPGDEMLVARSGADVADLLQQTDPTRASAIGTAAATRTRRDHTYTQRAREAQTVMHQLLNSRNG